MIEPCNISTSKRSSDSGDEVFIRWVDPPSPNGLIVLYDIELVKADVANVSHLTVCLFVCLSVCLSVGLSVRLCVCYSLSVCLSVMVRQSVSLSVYYSLSVCLSVIVCLSVCLSVRVSLSDDSFLYSSFFQLLVDSDLKCETASVSNVKVHLENIRKI